MHGESVSTASRDTGQKFGATMRGLLDTEMIDMEDDSMPVRLRSGRGKLQMLCQTIDKDKLCGTPVREHGIRANCAMQLTLE